MHLEHYSVKKLKKQIKDIVSLYLDLKQYQIFFFGSRVRGDNFERADVDIGIKGPRSLPLSTKGKIKESLDNLPTLYKFDFIDFQSASAKFKKEALKHIEIL